MKKEVHSHKKVYRGVPQGKEVYLYTDDDFTDDGTIDSVKRYLQSKKITDPLASYDDILDAVNNGFVIIPIFGWAADGYTYNINFDNYKATWAIDKPKTGVLTRGRGIFLFGLKQPENKNIFPPFTQNGAKVLIHPWHFDFSSKWVDMYHGPVSRQLYYAEVIGYNGLVNFEDAKKIANKYKDIVIAPPEQIQKSFTYDNSFYLDNKVGWGSDGKLYKTNDGTNITGTKGGVFFYGDKGAHDGLISFPFRYKIRWSRWDV